MTTKKETKKTAAYILCALLCVVALVLGIRFTVAAFTANDFLKAVAATNQTENLFASDVLAGYTSAPDEGVLDRSRRSLVLGASGETVSFDIEVYNHLKDDKNVVNTKDVEYDFTVEVKDAVDPSKYSVKCSNESATRDGATFSFAEKRLLRGNHADTDRFTVTMPTSDLGKVSFIIKAVATSGSGTNLWGLASKVVPAQAAKVDSAGVTGKLSPSDSKAYDAYNYEITVTGKTSKVKLEWDSSKVEIEPFFKEKYGVEPGIGTVEFDLQPGVTTVNFYQKDGHTDVTNEDFKCK